MTDAEKHGRVRGRFATNPPSPKRKADLKKLDKKEQSGPVPPHDCEYDLFSPWPEYCLHCGEHNP